MQNSNIKILVIGSYFILSLAPIGIETSILLSNSSDLVNVLNLFRLIIPIFIFLSIFIFFLKKLNIKNFQTNVFILFYFITIFVSTLLNIESINEAHKLLLPFYCINYIFLVTCVYNINYIKKKINKIIAIQFTIIIIINLFSLLKFFSIFFNLNIADLYGLTIENNFYSQNSNGLARILLIVSLYIFLVNKINFYYYLSCLLLNTILFLLQSKLSLFFLIFFVLAKVFFGKKKIHQKIKSILFVLAIPMVISFILSSLNSTDKDSKMRLMKEITIDIGKEDLNHFLDLRMLASTKGRIDAWKAMIESSEKPVIGYGSQGDRNLAKKLETNSQLASNSFVYALICSGFVGFFFLIVFYYKLIKFLFINNFLKDNLNFFYFTILIFLIIRSLFENGFAVWGFDLVLMVNSYLGLKNSFTKKKQ
jgi:hypothetical protein